MTLLVVGLLLGLLIWGLDRHLCLKDVEKDLRLMILDFSQAADLSERNTKVHYQATVAALKTLTRNHFGK